MKKRSTAILLFAQKSCQEWRRKRWSGPRPASPILYESWNQRTCQMARQTGLPVLRSSDLIDHEGSFSEQMQAAVSAVFQLGFEQLICIGNDCPNLDSELLCQADMALQADIRPVGPNQHGGAYLFGLKKGDWEKLHLGDLPWQKDSLSDKLICRLKMAGKVRCLASRGDVHSKRDLLAAYLHGRIRFRWVTRWLAMIRQDSTAIQPALYTTFRSFFLPSRASLRAPPTL